MILETSALVAVITGEPDRDGLLRQMQDATRLRMSVGSYLECAIVVDGRRDPVLSRYLDALLVALGVELVAVDAEQARVARRAYADFGRGSGHPAQLNFGDCFGYALSATSGEPLLYKGGDFGHTDIERPGSA
ncbi:type II toxin-antitoxin system VapC family toxin [Ornithinimicrobium cerasi]|uniref:Ribonuclease VapC n=1 Tax=Ornithinimicrobium cerasi TaxID=2248773 RepID=A0A285VI14_9MICO|nr:type II toxin-antitoxin system VapC family toxin [Ornithinimicrobium cerasi]SOC53690.1 ribonuclease VapC [Ornithinimicrobium cerasi]